MTAPNPRNNEKGIPMPSNKYYERLEHFGNLLVDGFHLLGLFVIGAVIVWATALEMIYIFVHREPTIKEILLLFIYLELGAMIGIYFKTKRLPVRFLLYIALTALTRVLAVDIKTMTDERMMMISAAILILAVAVLVIRIGTDRFPGHSYD
jgi:phosphate starvation-inducible membrane PsiE